MEVNGSPVVLPVLTIDEELDLVSQEALTTMWLLSTENPLPNKK